MADEPPAEAPAAEAGGDAPPPADAAATASSPAEGGEAAAVDPAEVGSPNDALGQ